MRRILTFLKIFRYDLLVMLVALRHRDTPKQIKGLLIVAILYLVSPVDLIPDTIPVLGIMDDAIIVPAAVCGLTHLLPGHVRYYAEHRADQIIRYTPIMMLIASLVVLAWIGLLAYGLFKLFF